MSRITINTDKVRDSGRDLGKKSNQLSEIGYGMNTIRFSLDYRIKNRRDIGNRMNHIIRSINIIEEKLIDIKKFMNNSMDKYEDTEDSIIKEELTKLLDKYYSLLTTDPFTLLAGRNAFTDFFSGTLDSDALLRYKDINFKVKKDKYGNVYIVLDNPQWTHSRDYIRDRDALMRLLGGESGDFKKRYVNRMLNGGGMPLYIDRRGSIDDNMKRFKNLDTVNQYIYGQDHRIKNMGSAMKNGFIDDLKVWQDFNWKDASNLTKAGKSFGAAGTLLTVGDNFTETFYSPKSGWQLDKGDKWVDFGVNLGVDVGVGAGAIAAGAAVGSFFAPPVGTVVGAGVGALINYGLNVKGGDKGKSVVDKAKDGANEIVDNVGKKLDTIFW